MLRAFKVSVHFAEEFTWITLLWSSFDTFDKKLRQKDPNIPETMGCIQSFRELCDRPKNTNVRVSLPAVCFVWQTAMIILFGVFIRYNEESDAHWTEHRKAKNISSDIENDFYFRYPSKWLLSDFLFFLFLFSECVKSQSSLLFFFICWFSNLSILPCLLETTIIPKI